MLEIITPPLQQCRNEVYSPVEAFTSTTLVPGDLALNTVLSGKYRSSSETFGCVHDVLVTSTGTIRTCQKFLIQYNTTQLLRLLQNCTNEGEFLQPLS